MRRRFVWVLLVTSSLVYVGTVGWWLITASEAPALNELLWVLVMVPTPVAAGAYLMVQRPENLIGDLLTTSSICTFVLMSILELPTVRAFEVSGAQGWMWAPMWAAQTLTAIGVVLIIALFVVIPDGRIRFPRERRLIAWSWVTVAFPTLSLLSNDLVQKEDISFPGVQGISSPLVFEWLAPLGTVFANLASVGFLLILGAIGVLYLRYRTASNGERKQVRWVLYGGAVAILIAGMPFALGEIGVIAPLGHTTIALVTSLPILLFYGSLVIAVTEPPWVDVDIVIRRSFVYGVLSFLILLLYIAAAAAFGVVAAGASLSIETAVVLTVVVAVLFQPARRRLQLVADRWVFGARPTRYEAVAEFGESIDRSSDPGELLPRLVDTIKKTIRVDWVTAQLDDGTFATSGAVTGNEALVTAIGMGSEEIGLIRCGPKVSGVFDDDERHLIQTFAAQVGLAVMNARLARSVVNAAEAERRRIERNIHDGAQQELVALVARLGMARSNAAKGTLDETVLNELRQEAQHILSDLRDLAQGIHPSVLSDGGILEAVEERCTHLPIDVTLNAAPSLRRKRFHDEVEGASYFFVSETLANVLKHADATKVEVTLGHEGDMIRLDVSDNGRGFEPDGIGQNGLAGLSDRIRALGGTLSISSRLNKGTTIRAELPASER